MPPSESEDTPDVNAVGLVVPIPTLPDDSISNLVVAPAALPAVAPDIFSKIILPSVLA